MAEKSRRFAEMRRSPVMIAATLFVAVACTSLGVAFGQEYLAGSRLRAANDSTEREIMRDKLETQGIVTEIGSLDTPAGIERAARRRGWTLANERRLRISTP